MRKYTKRSAIIMVSILVLSGCSSQKAVPSLENAGNMTEEELKQELSKFSREEINAAWGEGIDPFFGRYGELFQLDGERTLILCYESDGQTVEDVIFGENCQTFDGTIVEVHGTGAVVEVDDGFPIRGSGDRVSVALDEATASVQAGDRVRVTYSGAVMESYPLQLGKQKSIQLLEEETSDRIPMGISDGNLHRSVGEEPSVVKTYEMTDPELAFENDELVTMVKYYEMSDGTWRTDTHTYQYRLEITGRMGAAVDTTFVFLSNRKEITFEQAWKASGLSSNMNDYFKEEDAKLVAMR